ncbi:hypothetical protein Rcae01_06477 [Novipirellula caenicola]|uniref:Uncharacterized protein n=1 Tax=Novipirellula caenicola TaxID=1536901 RepID=A0ABP9W374_9BACT
MPLGGAILFTSEAPSQIVSDLRTHEKKRKSLKGIDQSTNGALRARNTPHHAVCLIERVFLRGDCEIIFRHHYPPAYSIVYAAAGMSRMLPPA